MSSIAGTSFKSATDLASLSTPDEIRQTHYSLDLTVDFGTKTLVGSTTISFVILKENANTIVLDTNGLDIHRVIIDDAPVGWTLGDSVDPFGRPLSITLPSPGKLTNTLWGKRRAWNLVRRTLIRRLHRRGAAKEMKKIKQQQFIFQETQGKLI